MDPASSFTLFASIPFDGPRQRTSRDILFDIKQGIDFVAHNLPRAHSLLVRLNPYPPPWRRLSIIAADGTKLEAWYAQGTAGGPAILFAPGTFQTKDDTPRKRRAIDLWRRLGASVLIVDLRGFGGSHDSIGSAGYHEARDLHLAADRLKEESGAEKVILWGESLGGAVSLIAASLPGAEERFARVIAWSPFADLRTASTVATPTTDIGRSMLGRTYRWLLRHRTKNQVRDFEEYLTLCAKHLDMSVADLCYHGSPVQHVARLRAPAFVFHAEDDLVVPVDHAHALGSTRAKNLRVEVVPRGAHLDFDRAAPVWYADVTRKLIVDARA